MENGKIRKNDPLKAISGWAKVEYVSAKSIGRFSIVGNEASVELQEDAEWATIEAGTIQQHCVQNKSYCYDHSIVVMISCRSNGYNMTLDKMTNDRYLLKLTDTAGDQWIAGCPDEPMRMDVQESDDDNPSDGAAHTITFGCKSRLPLMKTK